MTPSHSLFDDNTLNSQRSISVNGLYQNDSNARVNVTEYSRHLDTYISKNIEDQGGHLESEPMSSQRSKSFLSPRLHDNDREVKDWLKMRELEKR